MAASNMARYSYILSFFFLIISCNQNSSQAEKDYIKNLEEKNTILEKELKELRSKIYPNDTSQRKKEKSENYKEYFSIGSTEDEVIEVMGDPTTYLITAPEAKKFLYGLSTLYFYQGKVISYDNLDENLKVTVIR